MNIGINIFNIRTSKGIKQSEMAEKLGLEQSGYSRIEKRGNKISYDIIEKIAEILGVTPSKLLDLDVQIEVEKEKIILAHKIEIAMKDQVISDLGKIKKMTEEVLEDFCDMIEQEIEFNYEKVLKVEFGIQREEFDGNDISNFNNVREEVAQAAFHEHIFKNSIIYQYFIRGLYRHSKDNINIISNFLKFFKSYNPFLIKAKSNNPEIRSNYINDFLFVEENVELFLRDSLSAAHDIIKDKKRIIEMNDDILNNIVRGIDNVIIELFLEIWQCLFEERTNIGLAEVRLNGVIKTISLHEYYDSHPAFLDSPIKYDLLGVIFSFEEANILIHKLYESEWMGHYLAFLGDTLIFELCEHNEILERSKYLQHFRDYNNLENIKAEQNKPQDVHF